MHPIRKQRLYVVLSILLGTAVAAFLVFKGLSENINLFYSPSDLKKENISVDNQIRVGGMVKKNSIKTDSNKINFVITDFKNELIVSFEGSVPNLFEEGKGAVVEGFLHDRNYIKADKILAKHDENYMPPEVKNALEKSN